MTSGSGAKTEGGDGAGGGSAVGPHNQSSLYVGDLGAEVTEKELFELFSGLGPVMSIRICRDAVSKASLGYGYVNYGSPTHAARALAELNFTAVGGKPIRLMWSQRDPALRRSAKGNVFIKNLSKDVDNKSLHDTFSSFGKILSAKLATDERGASKGFAFVHFDSAEAAKEAIAKVNGKVISNKKVFVGEFKPRAQRVNNAPTFTNVFIKNLNKEETSSEALEKEVKKFGEVKSFILMTEQETHKSKGYAFVAYAKPEEAAAAVAELNGKELDKQKLFAGRAMKKEEREREKAAKEAARKREFALAKTGLNLYVKHLEEGVDEERLNKEFSAYGTITSARVMKDDKGVSKGFGFVCFKSAEEASKAVNEMNGRMLAGFTKPLFVALAQRKEDRQRQLASTFVAGRFPRQPFPAAPHHPNAYNSAYLNPASTAYGHSQPNFLPSPRVGAPGAGRWNAAAGSRYQTNVYAGGYGRSVPAPPPVSARPVQNSIYAMGGSLNQPNPNPNAAGVRQGYGATRGWPAAAQTSNYNLHFAQTARNRPGGAESYAGAATGLPSTSLHSLPAVKTTAVPAAAANPIGPADQKQILGEELYTQVAAIVDATSAGKVTGMLLEMPNAEIVSMLHQESLLHSKITEAMAVLHESTLKKA